MDIPDNLSELETHEFEFIQYHAMQLVNNGIPITKELAKELYHKLSKETFDAGEAFQLMEDPGDQCFRLQATADLKAFSRLFLVDHFFSFRYKDLRNRLIANEGLRKRLSSMTKFFGEKKTLRDYVFRPKKEEEAALNPEFDGDENLKDPRTVEVDWANVETLSFCHCGIEEADMVADMLTRCPKLKGLWLNGNPVSEGPKEMFMIMYLEEKHPQVQIYNSKFTKHAKEWAIKFATYGLSCKLSDEITIEEMRECDISGRNFYALKDDHSLFDRMQNVRTLKARDTFFHSFGEANRFIEMIRDMKKLERIELDYYMLDLFWDIKERIKKLNPTIRYICEYDLGYDKPKPVDEEVDKIIENMWKITSSYKIAQGENIDIEPVYYVLDEVGSALPHSDQPNVASFPFIYFKGNGPQSEAKTYNIVVPIVDIKSGEFASANHLKSCPENLRMARRGLWEKVDAQPFLDKYHAHKKEMEARREPGEKLIEKVLAENTSKDKKIATVHKGEVLKIFTDFDLFKDNLKDPRFKLVENIEEADLLFIIKPIKLYKEALGDKFSEKMVVNQFPYESTFANKLFLSDTIKKHVGFPSWMFETYDLTTELDMFIGDFLWRKSFNLPNYWITKPVTLTKSIDMAVTNNLDMVIRIGETGRKIVCKYLEDQLRYRGVKFDLRQYVLVRSFKPLEVYVYRDFVVRAAANDFTMDKRRIFQNETHFIYNPEKQKMNNIFDHKEFQAIFPKKYNSSWESVQEKINDLIRKVFALCLHESPGLQEDKSRAMYGLDVILDTDLNPKLMEITFSPNFGLISTQNKNFVDDVARCLYLGEENNVTRII